MYEHEKKSQLKKEPKKSEKKVLNQPENKNSEFQKELQLKEVAQKKNNTGLPDNLKSGIENLSGYSMDDVKVHYNSNKPAQLNAHAYAQGNQIHLGSGQEKHLAHEAWHVVQQKQGRVKPTVNVNGAAVNDSAALEKEADVMGGKALQRKVKLLKKDSNQENLNNMLNQQKPKTIQKMKADGVPKESEVDPRSGRTLEKHVVAIGDQSAKAVAAYTNMTFVTSKSDLTTPVDSDGHDFTEGVGVASTATHYINADVKIYQWNKTEGEGETKPSEKTIDGESKSCEIGVRKTGDNKIRITHFKKN